MPGCPPSQESDPYGRQAYHGSDDGSPVHDACRSQSLAWPQSLNPTHIDFSKDVTCNSDMEKANG
jgi:hypothetical protein